MARIPFVTGGLLKYPWGDPRLQNFSDRFEETFAAAVVTEGYEGYIGRPLSENSSPLPGFDEGEWADRKHNTYHEYIKDEALGDIMAWLATFE